MRNILISSFLLAAAQATAAAQVPATAAEQVAAADSVDAAQVSSVIEALAVALEENFVIPAHGKDYAAAIRGKLAAGAYAGFASREEFAQSVTADLQSVHKDGHLSLSVARPRPNPGPQRKPKHKAIEKSGWIADGVAYIRILGFPSDPATLQELGAFVDHHAGARALIIDVRNHSGGGGAEMDVLFPALFDKPTTLLQLDMRGSVADREKAELEASPTMALVDSSEGIIRHEHRVIPAEGPAMKKAQVFVLTSRETVSASEHLVLSLKRTGRATLIGQTTRGAGNFGRSFALPNGYSAFIPFGRTIDPDTGKGWEGVGVKPDIDVPADQALDEALRRAGLSVSAERALAVLK